MNARPCARAAASMPMPASRAAVARSPPRDRSPRARRRANATQLVVVDARRCEQMLEQPMAARLRLAQRDPRALLRTRSATRADLERIAGRQQQALRAPRPFERDDVGAGERCAHQRHVVVARRRIAPVHGSDRRLAARKPLDAGAAAAGEDREAAAGFAHRPFEQRVVAAGDDRRRVPRAGAAAPTSPRATRRSARAETAACRSRARAECACWRTRS